MYVILAKNVEHKKSREIYMRGKKMTIVGTHWVMLLSVGVYGIRRPHFTAHKVQKADKRTRQRT